MSIVAGHQKLPTVECHHQKWSSYNYTRSYPITSMSTILQLFSIWSKLGRVKKLDKWVPHELMTNQKNHHFGVSSLILHNSEPFLGLWCATKRILYDNQWWAAQWLDKEILKHFPKPNLHQKKSWSLFGGLLPVWPTTAFWTPVKPLQMRSMLSKSMRCTENCNAYSWHWSTECRAHNQWFKNWMYWAKKFCPICHIYLTSCQPTTTSSSNSTTFCKENTSTSSRRQKIAVDSRSMDLYAIGINKLISHWQKCDCNGSYFD